MIYINTKKREKIRITKKLAEKIKAWKFKYLFFLLLSMNLSAQSYLGINFNFKDNGIGLQYQYNNLYGSIGGIYTFYSEESSMLGVNFGYRLTNLKSDFDIFPTLGVQVSYMGNVFTDDLKPKELYMVKPSVGLGFLYEVYPVYFKLKWDALWNQPQKEIGVLFALTVGGRFGPRRKCEDKNRRR